MNAQWHAKHKMHRNPTVEQRIRWHTEHAKHCACRSIPPKIAEEMERGARIKSRS